MTASEARRAVTEAAHYLESLSLESNGTDTEYRLSQRLLAAALVIPRAERPERIDIENGQTATVQATIRHEPDPPPSVYHYWRCPVCSTSTRDTVQAVCRKCKCPDTFREIGAKIGDGWDDETRAKFRRAQGIIDRLQSKADAAGEELEPKRCERCGMPMEAKSLRPICLDCFQRLVDAGFASEPVAVPMGHVEPPF